MVHLLDDLLVITPPLSPPAHGLLTMKLVFAQLGVPLSEEKTEGPSHILEFLGISLDTVRFQASLPAEKLHRTILLLQNFLLTPSCTKRQLLSLLGFLNFALRIIPQGRSFISHLLSLASFTPSLIDPVSMETPSRTEMQMWLHLLSNWNGITFFYDDQLSNPEDIQLYTDAAPSAGFGGHYGRRWFSAEWPIEFRNFLQGSLLSSSAVHEIYPVVIAALLWGHEWPKRSILIHSDNIAIVDVINKGRTNSPAIMPFIRRLTWLSVTLQFILRAKHVPGHHNSIADSLSRFSFQIFRTLAPDVEENPTTVPPFSDTTFLI
ncbi:uncharacterized protein [Embiotoca jacksoni]|uniref:uncharacterized protein n=1 Tax=Embiotoca jacksoni TaxID=100190 RepID=UPI0037041092